MTQITIDNKSYDLESLSEEVKQELQMLQATDRKIAELNVELAIAKTARLGYARAVQGILENDSSKKN